MDVKGLRHMVSLADLLSELDFLQIEAPEELALSMVLQVVFAIHHSPLGSIFCCRVGPHGWVRKHIH